MTYFLSLLLVVLVVVVVATSLAEPTVTLTSTTPAIVPGYSPALTLTCEVDDLHPSLVPVYLLLQRISNNNNSTVNLGLVMGGRATPLVKDNRTTLKGSLADKDGGKNFLTLDIEEPVEEDAGQYVCLLEYFKENSFQSAVASADVTAQELPPSDEYVAPPPAPRPSNTSCCDINAAEIEKLRELLQTASNVPAPVVGVVAPARESCQVAFTAHLKDEGGYALRSQHVVIFDTAPVNVGQAYSTDTGVFTAPCNGLYQFSLTLTTVHSSSGSVEGIVRREGKYQARASSFSDYYTSDVMRSGSTQAVVSLVAGEEVDVLLVASARGSYVGLDSSVFTGHFLFGQ